GKQPIRIHALDAEPFAFAGLQSSWSGDSSGQILFSCVILTQAANSFIAPIHDRMPVILPESLWNVWTDAAQSAETALQRIFGEPFGRTLVMTRVSEMVNSPANDSEQCIAPIGDDDHSHATTGNLWK
ncbi:MAG: SOS response-associated peptidase family protein, partial [bacterium]